MLELVTDVIGGQVEQHPDVCVRESIINPPTISTSSNDVGSTEQPHCLTRHVLRDAGYLGQITHAQFPTLEKRMQDHQTSRVAE